MPGSLAAGRTVLVLGGSGFIGRAVARDLRDRGARVVIACRAGADDEFEACQFDLADTNARGVLGSIVSRSNPQVIVDLAAPAVSPSDRSASSQPPEVAFGSILTDVLREAPAVQLLHVSSTVTRGNDGDSYTEFKSAVVNELSHADSGRVQIVELPRVVGPGEPRGRFVSDLIAELAAGRSFSVEHPWRRRDFLGVASAARLVVDSVDWMSAGRPDWPCVEVCAARLRLREIAVMAIDAFVSNGIVPADIDLDHCAGAEGPCPACVASDLAPPWVGRVRRERAPRDRLPGQVTDDVHDAIASAVAQSVQRSRRSR